MKTRQGFVSNSSTSSFIVLTTKENFDKVLADSPSYMQKVINEMVCEPKKAFGQEMIVMATLDDAGYGFFDDFYVDWTEEEEAQVEKDSDYGEVSVCEVFERFTNSLSANEDECFTHSVYDG